MSKNPEEISDVSTKPVKPTKMARTNRELIKQELIKRRILINRYRNNYRLLGAVLGIILIVTGGYLVHTYLISSPIPSSIQKSTNFLIFYPTPSKDVSIEKSSFVYDKSKSQLTFHVSFENQVMTFAEQSSPDSFAANPNFYQDLVQSLGNYGNFDSINGRVDLTLPSQTKQQTAIMNAKGTLLFVNTPGKLSESQWKLLFSIMKNTQP